MSSKLPTKSRIPRLCTAPPSPRCQSTGTRKTSQSGASSPRLPISFRTTTLPSRGKASGIRSKDEKANEIKLDKLISEPLPCANIEPTLRVHAAEPAEQKQFYTEDISFVAEPISKEDLDEAKALAGLIMPSSSITDEDIELNLKELIAKITDIPRKLSQRETTPSSCFPTVSMGNRLPELTESEKEFAHHENLEISEENLDVDQVDDFDSPQDVVKLPEAKPSLVQIQDRMSKSVPTYNSVAHQSIISTEVKGASQPNMEVHCPVLPSDVLPQSRPATFSNYHYYFKEEHSSPEVDILYSAIPIRTTSTDGISPELFRQNQSEKTYAQMHREKMEREAAKKSIGIDNQTQTTSSLQPLKAFKAVQTFSEESLLEEARPPFLLSNVDSDVCVNNGSVLEERIFEIPEDTTFDDSMEEEDEQEEEENEEEEEDEEEEEEYESDFTCLGYEDDEADDSEFEEEKDILQKFQDRGANLQKRKAKTIFSLDFHGGQHVKGGPGENGDGCNVIPQEKSFINLKPEKEIEEIFLRPAPISEKRSSEGTCNVIFPASSTMILQRTSSGGQKVFSNTFKICNSSSVPQAYKTFCNKSALTHISILPKIGFVPPNSEVSVKVTTSPGITNSIAATDRISVETFPAHCTDPSKLQDYYMELEKQRPELICSHKANRVVLLDGENLAAMMQIIESISDINERNTFKDELYAQYSRNTLSEVKHNQNLHCVKSQLLIYNQQMRELFSQITALKTATSCALVFGLLFFVVVLIAPFAFSKEFTSGKSGDMTDMRQVEIKSESAWDYFQMFF